MEWSLPPLETNCEVSYIPKKQTELQAAALKYQNTTNLIIPFKMMYLCMHLLITNMNFIGYIFISPTSRSKKNIEALVITSKETGLEVNVDKTEYMVMSRDQNAGQSHNVKTDYSSFERVEEFKYLGTTQTDKILCRKK
jgi:hypothetical protein